MIGPHDNGVIKALSIVVGVVLCAISTEESWVCTHFPALYVLFLVMELPNWIVATPIVSISLNIANNCAHFP